MRALYRRILNVNRTDGNDTKTSLFLIGIVFKKYFVVNDESETPGGMHYRLMSALSPRMRTLDGPSVWQDYADGDTACLAASALCDRYMEYAMDRRPSHRHRLKTGNHRGVWHTTDRGHHTAPPVLCRSSAQFALGQRSLDWHDRSIEMHDKTRWTKWRTGEVTVLPS
jgi:hypothetical protein